MRNRFIVVASTTLLLTLSLGNLACDSKIDAESARAELESRELSVDLSGLQRAVMERDPALIDLFLAAGVDPNSFEKPGNAPLMLAARTLDAVAVERLLNGGASVEPLPQLPFAAASRGHLPLLELLLDAGAAIDAEDHLRRTPLVIAVDEARVEIVRMLLERGANTEGAKRGDHRQTRPLIQAATLGLDEIVQLLIDAGANLESVGGRPASTPLGAAARAGQLSTVQLLLAAGADPEAPQPGGASIAEIAANAGHDEIAALLR